MIIDDYLGGQFKLSHSGKTCLRIASQATNDKSCSVMGTRHSGLLRKLAMTAIAASSLRACEAIQMQAGNIIHVTSFWIINHCHCSPV